MRIAIVNDMSLAVEALRRVVLSAAGYSVAWVARDGLEAVEKCSQDRPDLILMDLVMPKLDGVEATRRIMAESPCAILVVTSSVSRMAPMVFEALGAGARDAIKTPVMGPHLDGSVLLTKIRQVGRLIAQPTPAAQAQPPAMESVQGGAHPLIVVGASSGGPGAVSKLLQGLPQSLGASVVIVQHIDLEFVPGLVSWLGSQTACAVAAVADGQRPAPGAILVACTAGHLRLARGGVLEYSEEPASALYRPSIDIFFDSVARYWPGPVLGVILTGMGADGAEGLAALRRAGHHTVAQDQASSAIYGMPKVAAQRGAAVEILPLEEIAGSLTRRLEDLKRSSRGSRRG